MNTEQKLAEAKRRLRTAQNEVKVYEEQLERERAFKAVSTVYVLKRHTIDTGRFEGIVGIFTDVESAIRFAEDTPGYGLDKDLFIEPLPLRRHETV